MENKRYLDKVLEHLVRGTKIDNNNNNNNLTSLLLSTPFVSSSSRFFSSYCKNTFGLTEDEISYVWKEYIKIIKDKINQ